MAKSAFGGYTSFIEISGGYYMKALFIGGTGTISMAITRALQNTEWDLYLLNRGNRKYDFASNIHQITADISDEAAVKEILKDMSFDVVCDFIGFEPEQVERDYRLFAGKTRQYMYISSASAYAKPVQDYRITEGTALANPYWEYSRNKIACEDILMTHFRNDRFPVTIIRPSHTYDERFVPLGVHGPKGSYQVIKRMMEGKPVIIHGDGTALWTMTHNSDFARGFIGLMGNSHAIGEAFQITGEESLTWNQIFQCVADALNVPLKPYYVSSEFLAKAGKHFDVGSGLLGDKAHTVVFDNAKLQKAVPEFCTRVPFAKGVRQTIEYVLSHPECQTEDPDFDSWCDKVIAAQDKALESVLSSI